VTRSAMPTLIAGFLAALSATADARAEIAVEGDLQRLTVVATQADPSDVIVAIGSRFSIPFENLQMTGGMVTGRFSGTLSEVLRSVTGGNGFAIAYRNGLPVRVTFTAMSAGSTYMSGGVPSTSKPRTELVLKEGAAAQPAPPVSGTAAPADDAPPPAYAVTSDEGLEDLSQGEATRQAVSELETLLQALREDLGK
jgi:hypothetical protein